MKRLTSLPVLLSALFFWTLSGTLGCDGGGDTTTGGGGTGATGGSTGGSGGNPTTGGGGSGGSTGGAGGTGGSTGGTGGSGGSTGGSGGTGGGTSALPTCEPHPTIVLGCVQSDTFEEFPALPFNLETTGLVTAVRSPSPGEVCGASYWYRLGFIENPEVMLDLMLEDGSDLTVGLKVPGFTMGSISEGQTLSVKYGAKMAGFGGRYGLLEIQRDGELVVAVGENVAAGKDPLEGEPECYSEDQLCGRKDVAMKVEGPDGNPVSIANGETVAVGDLTVTNERYFHNYDVSGGCNFGLPVEYLMSAAAK